MKIRTKTVVTIAVVAFVFFIGLSTVATLVIQPSFNNIEKQESNQGMTQTLNAINYSLNQIRGDLRDYSDWDDTYNFAEDGNQNYIQDNMVDSTFEQLNLNLIVVADVNGCLEYCQSFDLNNSVKVQTTDQTKQTLESDKSIWEFSSTEATVSGIMLLDNQSMLVVSAPVLTTTNQGPINAGMLFGRYLDAKETSKLQTITDLNFSIDTLADFKLNNSRMADSLFSNPQGNLLKENGRSTLSDYMLIDDVNSEPTFVLQVTQSRTAYQQEVWAGNIFLVAAVLLTIAFGVSILILLETSIIKPMIKLASQIENMPLNPDVPKNKSKFETDEISIIANSASSNLNKKLEAITEVSRMVGHDLRNPLSGIKNAVYILKKNYGSQLEEKGNAQLKTIDDCVEYSDKIVRDLLEYSTVARLGLTKTNLKKLIDDSLSTFTVPSNVQLANDVKDDQNVLLVDNGQIQRVFSNLIKNAFDAMPNGGKLQISSGRKMTGKVAVAFSDSGVGMSEETLKKLWTPFFTTKAKGLGVGLSICKKVIEAHGGTIKAESTLGKGTTFTVHLPTHSPN